MTWLPLLLGAVLGLGVLLVWRGFRILSDRSRSERDRRAGFWWLNGGLALVALSVFAFTRSAR
jgi:hypothetical protein